IINDNQDKVQEYKSGKIKLYGFFVGEVMKLTKGKANPNVVNLILSERLSN
ncbi:Asp-tRNA(Asn)/Glu-tRNA(Gln) amidotransferase GatCAB subunit B, partial [Wolbachia endosymbiont of Onchocerca gibsoni]|nr:Asp-tRNA(Asn)/Glu-tRNA(Gln) amidotransferase GatCAB subunit B [Wolbachia endosymbiont of Onchocerca gibsoni]